MWVIVVKPPLQSAEVIGPFETYGNASAFEDAHVDAPEGSRASIVRIVSAEAYKADMSAENEEGARRDG